MLIAYAYGTDGNVSAQFLKISNFKCRSVINDVGTASFDLDPSEEGVSYSNLKEFTRFRIAVVVPGEFFTEDVRTPILWDDDGLWSDSGTWDEFVTSVRRGKAADYERTVFEGVVRETEATQSGISVTLNDYLYVLKKKKLYSAKSYSSVSVRSIIQEVLDEAAARHPHGITLDCDVTATVSKQYKAFSSVYDVLQDLAAWGYEFAASGLSLSFRSKLWTDRTSGEGFVEFRSDVRVPQEINVAEYSIRRDSENFANAATATSASGTSTSVDASSVSEYGRIEETFPVDGSAAAASAAVLAERKDGVTEVSVKPVTTEFFTADVGDTVAVYVDGGNEMQFYDGALRVVEKGISYDGSNRSLELVLSVNKVSTPTILDTVKSLRERVKKLET